MKHDDVSTGWSFDCPVDQNDLPPRGGIVLENVRHHEHNFAKEIRLIALWLEFEQYDEKGKAGGTYFMRRVLAANNYLKPSKVKTLKPADPPAVINETIKKMGGKTIFQYLKETDEALYFSPFFKDSKNNDVAYGVQTTFDGTDLMAKIGYDNCEYSGIIIDQIFLFSYYTNEPKHEPSGGLFAARFHPLVKYKFLDNASFDTKKLHFRIKSIRFDYRLHLVLDRHHEIATNAKLTQIGNQAGLFADSDDAGGTVLSVVGGKVLGGGSTRTVTRGAFDAAEKSVLLEVVAPGLTKGFPRTAYLAASEPEAAKNRRCWDNIHWWGRRYEAGKHPVHPSTPGAFHAAHIHWRWGAAINAVWPVSGIPVRFNPDSWPDTFGSGKEVLDLAPLVDPRIFGQSISIAISTDDDKLNPSKVSLEDLSTMSWESLFTSLREKPGHLHLATPVLWYAATVFKTVAVNGKYFDQGTTHIFSAAKEGTVFLHGIFFAHDAEPDKSGVLNPGRVFNASVGDTGDLYTPKSWETIMKERKWVRWAVE